METGVVWFGVCGKTDYTTNLNCVYTLEFKCGKNCFTNLEFFLAKLEEKML